MAAGNMIRCLLSACLLASAAACASVPATVATESQGAESAEVSFEAIAPGVWMHTEYHTVTGFGRVVSHGLIVENGETAVLVDTGWDDDQTRAILQWAAARLRRPIAAAIVTHAHADKIGGLAALHAAGVETFAFRLTNADAPKRGLTPARVSLDFDSHGWLTPESREKAAPLGKLRLFYPGAGHTRDNIVVGIPGASILFGGCLIRPPGATDLGNTADGDVGHWQAAALAAGAAFPDATIVIPSHGDPAGRELIALTADLASAAAKEES
jgi:glyoxylase-like metal-dependent hydrolase (beta-lactamase superfamily II)